MKVFAIYIYIYTKNYFTYIIINLDLLFVD